jgi:hypothetical protein
MESRCSSAGPHLHTHGNAGKGLAFTAFGTQSINKNENRWCSFGQSNAAAAQSQQPVLSATPVDLLLQPSLHI